MVSRPVSCATSPGVNETNWLTDTVSPGYLGSDVSSLFLDDFVTPFLIFLEVMRVYTHCLLLRVQLPGLLVADPRYLR